MNNHDEWNKEKAWEVFAKKFEKPLDDIHFQLMCLTDRENKQINWFDKQYNIKATFDEIIDGDKYYTYDIDVSDGTTYKNLFFSQTYKVFYDAFEDAFEDAYIKISQKEKADEQENDILLENEEDEMEM